jgi:hypothetical protein
VFEKLIGSNVLIFAKYVWKVERQATIDAKAFMF